MQGKVIVKNAAKKMTLDDFLSETGSTQVVYDADNRNADFDTRVYRASLYYTELQVATKLQELNIEGAEEPDEELEEIIDEIT
jgi:exodeoxyribonuclease V alpha subunit